MTTALQTPTQPFHSQAKPADAGWLERHSGLLLHEAAFLGYLTLSAIRLAFAGPDALSSVLFHAGLVLGGLGLVWWTRQKPTALRWRLRLAYYPVIMNAVFVQMKTAIPLMHPEKVDAVLAHWDAALFGQTPALWLSGIATPWLTELLSLCYVLFFPYLVLSVIRYLRAPLPVAKRFFAGLFLIYGIGFLGYSVMPALGPYLAMSNQFAAPLQGYWITWLNQTLYPHGTNYSDVFPSLHLAVSAYLLCFDRTHVRWRFWLWLPVCIGLWLSTVYLRFHYGVDLLVGAAVTALAFALLRADHAR
ncbi:MAG: phosphatase PAP2 family protein [Rhodospirillaceae bacterium]